MDERSATSTADRLDIRPLDLRALVAEAWSAVRPAAPDAVRPVALRVYDLPQAHGDPNLVRQALTEMLGHVLAASAGEAAPAVEVGDTIAADGEVAYYVSGNGSGAGTDAGPGLAVAQRIIARHGGRFRVRTAPGRGITVSFTLPAPLGPVPRQRTR